MSTYKFANAQHTLVLRDGQLIPWHFHANTPTLYYNATRWAEDGSPPPEPFTDDLETKNALRRAGVKP